jgi:hypothetical protein
LYDELYITGGFMSYVRIKTVFAPLIIIVMVSLIAFVGGKHSGTTSITPVQARSVRTIELVLPDGGLKLVQVTDKTYARDSRGSVYQRNDEINPDTGETLGTITTVFSVSDSIAYVIDPGRKTISLDENPFNDPVKSFARREHPPNLRRETYLGRSCVVFPSDGKGNIQGEIWIDEVSNFVIYMRSEVLTPRGKEIRTTKTTEIVTGIEPHPDLFQVPKEGYTIRDIRREGKKAR